MRPIKKHLLIATLCGISAINTAFAQTTECNLPITSEQTDNKTQLRKFDIKDFNKHNIMGERYITLHNGVVIWQWDGEEDYLETIKKNNSPYECTYAYNRKGQLIREGKRFYGYHVGLLTVYDGKGNIIEQINLDKDYPFTIDQLVEKMKREFNLDLLNMDGKYRISVNRLFDEQRSNKVYYEVYQDYYGYLIDAATGELLFQSKLQSGRNRGSIERLYDKYLQSLNTKQQP